MEHFQERHVANLECKEEKRQEEKEREQQRRLDWGVMHYSDIADEEAEFLESLNLTPFQKRAIRAVITKMTDSGDPIDPSPDLRESLVDDLDFTGGLCVYFPGYHKFAGDLYESYLLGMYRPDSSSREKLAKLIVQRTRGKWDFKEGQMAFPYDEWLEYSGNIFFRTAQREREEMRRKQRSIATEAEAYLRALPLAEYTGDKIVLSWVARGLRAARNGGGLAPSCKLRPQLEEDLALIASAPRATSSKSWMTSCLISAYLRGKYTPNSRLREEVNRNLQHRGVTLHGKDERGVEQVAEAVMRPYLRKIGAYGDLSQWKKQEGLT